MISFIRPILPGTVLGTGNTQEDRTDSTSAAVKFMLSKSTGGGQPAPEWNLKGQTGTLVGGWMIQREAQKEWL